MISENPIIRLGLFLGLLVIMFAIEGLKPARFWKESRKSRVWFSAKLAILNNLFFRLVVAAPFVAFTHYVTLQGWGVLPQLKPALGFSASGFAVFEVVVTIVVFDAFDYMKHRWFHRVGFMWRAHRVHHTDTHLDILTALRYHPAELLISTFIKGGWLVIWGPSAFAFVVFEIVLNMASQFHHSNIDFPERVERALRKFLVTPRYHAMHHTIHRDKGDYNFSTISSVWDRLGGTQKMPDKSDIDLERLGVLQEKHLSLTSVLKSPLLPDIPQASKTKSKSSSQPSKLASVKFAKPLLLDVREEHEILTSGLPQEAVWIPLSVFNRKRELADQFVKAIGFEREIQVYCAAGVRSQNVASRLVAAGGRAVNAGGLESIKKRGLKLEAFRPSQSGLEQLSTATL